MKKDVWRNASVALVGVILTILFGVVSMRITEPDTFTKLGKSPTTQQETMEHEQLKERIVDRLLGVQFELWLVGLSIFMGAYFKASAIQATHADVVQARGALSPDLIVLCFVGFLLLILALEVVPAIIPSWKTMFSVVLPDIVGMGTLAFAVSQIK